MTKGILATLMILSFGFSSFATYEIQINGTYALPLVGTSGGTGAGILISNTDGLDSTDLTLAGEVYMDYTSQLQFGGLFLFSDQEILAESVFGFGALARYNLETDLRNSIFVGGGLRYIDFVNDSNFALLLSAGKRFPISNTLTWTPNATLALNFAGDIDSGSFLALNFISFSGFMD